jgi:O-methyltransferase involved in polyketide biosynthesis
MHLPQRRRIASRMAEALRYLQREARAAALDEVAAALAHAERSAGGAAVDGRARRRARPPIGRSGHRDAVSDSWGIKGESTRCSMDPSNYCH